MRIIAGEFRSRKLLSLPGMDTRPTSDRLRETLFNILNPIIGGSVFVDAYAGTGAVGIEAISRWARHTIFIEKDRDVHGTRLGHRGVVLPGTIILMPLPYVAIESHLAKC